MFEEKRGEMNDIVIGLIVTSSFSKSSVLNNFPSTLKRKAGAFQFLWFEERFRFVLVWTGRAAFSNFFQLFSVNGALDSRLHLYCVLGDRPYCLCLVMAFHHFFFTFLPSHMADMSTEFNLLVFYCLSLEL